MPRLAVTSALRGVAGDVLLPSMLSSSLLLSSVGTSREKGDRIVPPGLYVLAKGEGVRLSPVDCLFSLLSTLVSHGAELGGVEGPGLGIVASKGDLIEKSTRSRCMLGSCFCESALGDVTLAMDALLDASAENKCSWLIPNGPADCMEGACWFPSGDTFPAVVPCCGEVGMRKVD